MGSPTKPASKRKATASTGSSRQAQVIARRQQLLDTALKLFCEHGFAGTSTKRIAREAGVVEGLVFHYFPTKEHILVELASRSSTFAGKGLEVLKQTEGRTAREVLRAIASAFGGVSSEERMFVGFMLAEAQLNAVLGARVRSAHELAIAGLEAHLSARVAAGELRAGASLSTAIQGFLGGFVFFLGQHRHLGDRAWRREAARFAEEWADLCWRGLAASEEL